MSLRRTGAGCLEVWALCARVVQLRTGLGVSDPVTLRSGQRSTRCADCREPGDLVRPRTAWRRERDPHDGRAHKR